MIKIDLHLHSIYSDGKFSPTELVEKASLANVKAMSLTDHDTLSGVNECLEACLKHNIQFVPGIELSTEFNGKSVHILGYFKDKSYKNIELLNFLKNLKQKRIERCYLIVEKLKEHFDIILDIETLISSGNEVIARPHIAQCIINAGYPYDFDYIFDNIIGNDCPAYVPANKITTEEGIRVLKDFGATVFLAHPISLKGLSIKDLLHLDFDGIEAFYPKNSPEDTAFFLTLANQNNLLVSCGSDFHGIKGDSKHGEVGCLSIPDYLIKENKTILKS